MSRFEDIEKLFHDALRLPEDSDRSAWLAVNCNGDATLRAEVESLLKHHFLASTSVFDSAALIDEAPSVPVETYGVYKLVRLIGRGGMSAVYLAERSDGRFEQTVAVKVMAAHLAGRDFQRRFANECRFLAALQHPQITSVLDAGVSSSGHPYIVMEYIEGEPLDRYCDERKLGVEARLRLFLQVCDAVEYAHQKLILHRDLKPGNILVTSSGSVKLLDFGTAALIDQDSAVTTTRARMLTPRYASPEHLRGDRPGVASDVFSLGVILYELVTGAWPFGDPESLSSKLLRLSGDTAATSPAAAITDQASSLRSQSADRLRRTMAGDLSAILLKALEHEPERRYATVAQLVADIDRFLNGAPVEARHPTVVYRTGKFLRRHWISVSVAALFVISLSSTTLIALSESRVARSDYAELRSLTTMLLSELKEAINDVPGSTEAQRLLANRVVKTLDRMEAQSTRDPSFRADLAEAYRQLAEVQASPYVQNLSDDSGARANLTKATTLLDRQLAANPRDAAALKTKALVERTFAEVDFGVGKDATAQISKAVALLDPLLATTTDVPLLFEGAVTHQEAGDMFGQPGTSSLGDPVRAEAEYRRTMEFDRRVLRINPSNPRALRGVGFMSMKIGDLYRFGDPEKALEEYRHALQALEQLPAQEQSRPANLRFRATYLRKIGGALRDLQQFAEAEVLLQTSLQMYEKWAAEDALDTRALAEVGYALESLVLVYDWNGDTARGLPVGSRMVAVADDLRKRSLNSRSTIASALGRYHLAVLLDRAGKRPAAARVGGEAVSQIRSVADKDKATAQELILGSEILARILPPQLRDGERAVRYALRYQEMKPPGDISALYTLAFALNTRGPAAQAKELAAKTLALLPPPRAGHMPRIRTELEEISAGTMSQ
ncbi:MAG TPA: protein kinase [Bryobacteraceae bacterium]|nr:protein kinase [Bryobacteraceae bacterium]